MADEPRAWTLWHPHQKLWNWRLVSRLRDSSGGLGSALVFGLICADSILLALRVLGRRVRLLDGRPLRRRRGGPDRPSVLYIDCGLHKRGEQVRCMHRWFSGRYDLRILGFEASEEHSRDAAEALADVDGVRIMRVALVGPDTNEEAIRLYKSGGSGKADSLFGARGEDYELVPARRLSQVLAEEGFDLDQIPTILRMNIEGAEKYVIEDLIAAGLHRSIDGYYGMWDDLSKIDPEADLEFRELLRAHGISSLAFNDRDLLSPGAGSGSHGGGAWRSKLRDLPLRLRRLAIRADIAASIRHGLARVGTK